MPYHKTPVSEWHKTAYSEQEKRRIIEVYSCTHGKGPGNAWLSDLARELNRPRENISRFARRLGLTNRPPIFPKRPCVVCGRAIEVRKKRKTCDKKCSSLWMSKLMQNVTNDPLYRQLIAKRTKEWIKKQGHPKGMKGKRHSDDVRAGMSERFKKMWADPASKVNSQQHKQMLSDRMSLMQTSRMRSSSSAYSNAHHGWRDFDGGKRYFMRSRWEMNYGRYLDFLLKNGEILEWDYEADTFWFEAIRRGVRSYTPDFKITNKDGRIEYHEVKGWMDPKSATKLKRMKKYYPDVVLHVIDKDVYNSIKSKASVIAGWE